MAETNVACQAYRRNSAICRNGFPQKGICWGALFAASTPHCMDDDFAPPHLIDDAGLPRLAAHRLSPTPPEQSPTKEDSPNV